MLERMRYWLGPRRPWLWILLVLLLYTLGGFFLAPWLVERQLVSLSAERVDLSTTVDNIDINPYTFTVTMEGLEVTDSEDAPLLALERLFVNYELSSLVRRAWTLEALHLIGLDVALQRYSDGDTNIGVIADRWETTAEPEEEEPEEEGGMVRLVIADLVVDSASLSLVDNVPATRFETRIDPLDLHVENLSTLPDENGDQSLILSMGDDAVLTWSGASSLNPLRSEGRITLQGPYPGLIHEYFQDQLPFTMSGGEVSAALDYRAGVGTDDSLSADITGIQFSMADTEMTAQNSGELLVSLREISLENGELRWPANTVSLDAVRLRGFAFHPVREEDGTINFVALVEEMTAGQNDAAADDPTAPADEPDPWRFSVGELTLEDWQIDFDDRVPETDASIDLGLDATLADISTVPDSQMQLNSSVEVASGGTLSMGGTLVALPELQFNGEVDLNDLELGFLQPYIQPVARISIDAGQVGADGTVALSVASQSYQGSASVSDLALTDQNENGLLFSIDSLQVNGIALQQSDEPGLDVNEIRLESPYARVEIDEDGSTNIGRVLVPSDAEAAGSDSADGSGETTEQETGAGMPIAVDSILVNGASADFADWSLPLPFSVAMTSLAGDISSLSTQSQQPASVALEGQVGEFGMVTISGELRPLALTEETQINLVFRNVGMPQMTPYVIDFAGREIDGGSLDLDLTYRIENSQLSGDNVVVMRDLVLGEEVSHPGAANLPLGIAVALLKDRNGVINLAVPVTGDVNDPEFNLGGVIGNAITTALTNIATSPFRFLAGLVGFEDDDLAVVEFAPGRSDVTPPQQEKLVNLAEALAQRPQLRLRVPPVYAEQADEEALAALLLDQRIESRVSSREEPSGRDQMTATAHRITVLEELLVEQGLVAEEMPVARFGDEPASAGSEETTTLAMLQLMNMVPAPDTGEARLDQPAYVDTLRNRLLEQQSVPREELEALARQRAETALAVIRESASGLEQQTSMADAREVGVGDEGQIVMTLELETAD
ncbi:MAG: DUF748 domain-containing protein [Pseudohongiellaceae bacterium]